MLLAGRRALVIGASRSWIGRAVVTALAKEGVEVVVQYFETPGAAADIVEEVERGGRHAIAMSADISDREARRQLARRAARRLDGLDLAIAVSTYRPEASDADAADPSTPGWHDNGVGYALECMREAADIMLGNGSPGRIVLLDLRCEVAGAATLGATGLAGDHLSQRACEMACEWAPAGITVNVVRTGILTEDARQLSSTDAELRRAQLKCIPMARFGEIDEVVAAVLFLASAEAGYITGTSLLCDGGMALADRTGYQPRTPDRVSSR